MKTKIAINGFGRIGRQVLKAIKKYHGEKFDVVVRIRCFIGAMFFAAVTALIIYFWEKKSNSPGGHGDGAVVFFLVMLAWPLGGFAALMKLAITGKDFNYGDN